MKKSKRAGDGKKWGLEYSRSKILTNARGVTVRVSNEVVYGDSLKDEEWR